MRADPMADVYLTEVEFADRYKLSRRTVQRWRYTGDGGPAWVRLGFRRIGYRLSDCEAWAAGHTFSSRAHEMSVKAAS